jgi:diguanylate cyclase (GGDEF)-like protein/PAS domain S-box-containing protein
MKAQETERATVLVVEDDIEMAWMISDLLERRGYSAIIAQSGEEALDLLDPAKPLVRSDLILLDVLMEGLDGYQVCQRLKQDERLGYIPIIMVTVLDSLPDRVKGLGYGADDYVTKPFKGEELLARIGALLRVKRLYDKLKGVEEEIRQRTAQLEALRQVGLEVTAQLDLDALLRSIVSRAVELLEGTAGGLDLYQPERDALEWIASMGIAPVPGRAVTRRGEGLSGRVLETGEPLIVDDYQHWEGRAAAWESYPFTAVVGVPVRWGGEFLGVLEVLADPPRTFSSADAKLLSLFATQAAIAIRNARLYEGTRSRAEQLAVVNRLAGAAGATLHLDDLMETVYREVSPIFQADAFFIALYDEEVNELDYRLRVDEGTRERRERRPLKRGLTALVVSEKKPILIRDFEKEKDHLPEISLWGTMRIPASWLGVPMRIGERVIGVICVQAYRPHAYGEEEQLLLSTIADQVAVAIENARLYETAQRELAERVRAEAEIRQRNRELAALNAIATTMMQSALDLDEMLQRIADDVVEGLGCNTAVMLLLDEEEEVFKGRAVSTRSKILEKINAILGFPLAQIKFPARHDFNETVSSALDGRITIKHDLYELVGPALSKPICSALQGLLGSKTFLGLPLLAMGKVVGGVFASTTREELGEKDKETFMTFANQAAIAIENARLFKDVQQRAQELADLSEASQTITSSLDLKDVLAKIVSLAGKVVDSAATSVMLVKEDGSLGLSIEDLQDIPSLPHRARPEGMTRHIIATGDSVVINEVFEDGATEPSLAGDKGPITVNPALLEVGIKSLAGIPIISRGKVSGVLFVRSMRPYAFQGKLPLLTTFANQIAIAIENARLFEETDRLKAFNEGVVQGVAEAILIEDTQGILTFANPAAEELLGYTREELIGRHWSAIVPEDEIEKVSQELARRPRGAVNRYETALLSQEGQVIPVIVSARPLLKESRFAGVLSAFTDITARVQAEREIEKRRLYLEGLLGAAPDAIVTVDAHYQIVEWNPGAERLFGYSREEAIGHDLDDLVTNPDVFEEAVGFTQRVMGGKELPPTEAVRYRKDGSPVDVIVAGSPILVGDEWIGAVAVYTDITQRVRMEETLRALALVDELTGLYNRRGFVTLSQQQLKTADRTKRRMLLLFADFDKLKQINDTFGHPEGDRALIEAADVLRETFRESDIMARIGGDEFVVLAIETDRATSETLTTRLQKKLKARNARGGRPYTLSLSVGVARYDPEHPCSVDDLLARADRAMYEQKGV